MSIRQFCRLILEPRRPRLGAVDSPSKVRTDNSTKEKDHLEEEPRPAALLLRTRFVTGTTTATIFSAVGGLVTEATLDMVQVFGLDGDDVVVVAQFTCLGGQAQVGDRRNSDASLIRSQTEAVGPCILRLVL